VNVRQLAAVVADDTGLTLSDTEATLWAAFDAIARTVAAGESFTLSNFGTFEARVRKPGKHQNIATGETVAIPEHRVARFRPTGRLRDMVRDGDATGTIRKLPKGGAAK